MDKDLERRNRKAKQARARRSPSLSGGKKKCKIGKSCGATCIARHEICAVDLADPVSSDLAKASGKVSSGKPKENDKLSSEFSKHLEENSFTIPGRSFTHRDVANMVNQAAAGLTGEARENIDKMRQFVVRDKQVLFVSTNGGDGPFKGRGFPKWVQYEDFLKLLDKSIDFQVWGPALGLMNFFGAKSFSAHMKAYLDSEMFRGAKEGLKKDKAEELKLERTIAMRRKRGWKTDDQEFLLEELKRGRRTTASLLGSRLRNYSNIIAVSPGAMGSTNPGSRMTLLADSSKDSPYSSSQRVDSGRLQQRVSDVISRRATAKDSTDIAELDKGTFTFAGNRKGGPNNDTILMAYVHEIGHQIQFRSGKSRESPPEDSISLNRQIAPGITRYSRETKNETFAEAFVAYVFNPKALRDHDEPLYNWVRDTVEKGLLNAGTNTGVD
jgi:hypothetical protein